MPFRAASLQLASTLGEVEKNLDHAAEALRQCLAERVDLAVLPECAVQGYAIQDAATETAISASDVLAGLTSRLGPVPMDVVVGFYEQADGRPYNSCAYLDLQAGAIRHVHRKFFLPTYGTFDEARHTQAGSDVEAFDTRLGRFGMLICEDVWHTILATLLAVQGAQMLLVPVASPARGFAGSRPGNMERYERMLHAVSDEHGVYALSSCHVGFEGGKGLTGAGFIFDPFGSKLAEAPALGESILISEIDLELVAAARAQTPLLTDLRSRWARVQEIAGAYLDY